MMEKKYDIKILGLPLYLYGIVFLVTVVCIYTGCIPKSLVPAFLVLMVIGEGLNTIGNTIPVVKTYLGGSVICILGAALIQALGWIPEQTFETMDYFVNESGFLIFYIAALITGSLFNIDRSLLLRATVKLLPVALISLFAGILTPGMRGNVFELMIISAAMILGLCVVEWMYLTAVKRSSDRYLLTLMVPLREE